MMLPRLCGFNPIVEVRSQPKDIQSVQPLPSLQEITP
jgi:hypothetical protein